MTRVSSPALGVAPGVDVERVDACPVCASPGRSQLLGGLKDELFGASGEWTMWRCVDCRSCYLDPRLTREAIHTAYQSYYTHAPDAAGTAPEEDLWAENPVRLRNPLFRRVGALVSGLLSRTSRTYVERGTPPPRAGARLLDIGCGNGAFLARAQRLGWEVYGCDFDSAAVRVAKTMADDVREGGAEAFDDERGTFDAVTLSHVIEHVHDPIELLRACYELLRPGGFLFIDTPNADALGLKLYGRNWRGLEPPRHLVLFNWSSLERAMTDVGFENVKRLPQRGLSLSLWLASDRLRAGGSPYESSLRPSWRLLANLPRLLCISEGKTEFVTLTGRKPPS